MASVACQSDRVISDRVFHWKDLNVASINYQVVLQRPLWSNLPLGHVRVGACPTK